MSYPAASREFSPLAERWKDSVESYADRPCLVIRGETYTYRQMNESARRWAAAIRKTIGRPATRVGVFASRSRIAYGGILASLLSGAAFVPLNPRFPSERTRRMIEAADLDAVIADRLGAAQIEAVLASLPAPPPILMPEDLERLETEDAPHEDPPRKIESELAYLLFTSGSTGQPKGVPITEGNLRAYLNWAHARYEFQPSDRFSQTFDQTFDLSVHDQFLCWESGASLYVLSPPELLAPARFIAKNQLTVWFSVPSVVAQMRKRNTLLPGAFPSLRWSLFCGEPLPQSSAEAWQAAAPASTLENLYGPTELTIACTVHRWDPNTSPALCRNGMVPIGLPFPGLTMKFWGEDSELAISGPQTSPGYWKDPDRSAEVFLDLPDGRFYRTGDRVAQLPNGELMCLGRVDHQVKVLGFRVELGEIEAALRRNPNVLQATAIAWPIVEGTAHGIIAFVQGEGLDPDKIREECRRYLSDYMVPQEVRALPEFPLNANGKVDRKALAALLDQSCQAD